MSRYLGEIVEKSNTWIQGSKGNKINLDDYHQNLPCKKGDSIILSSKDNKLLFMIPTDRKSIEDSIKSPISGISPIFAKMIISGSEKYITKNTFSPETSKDKILSTFFNMVVWKEFYFNHRGTFFRDILNNTVPNIQVQKFITYWLDEHLRRQFLLWGLSEQEMKIMIEDVTISNEGKIDIEDLLVMISSYPGRFLYVCKTLTEDKIKHLTQIFEADEIPYGILKAKRELNRSNDSYITFSDMSKESIGKYIGIIGKYGLISFDNDTKLALLSTYKMETSVSRSIITKIKKSDYNWKESETKLRLNHHNLSPDQRDGIKMVFSNQISVVTGGPGTGKTMLIKGVIQESIARGIPYHVAAFTGKAVGRVKETAYPDVIESSTIDMMIVQGPNHYKFNLLILEEASMITTKYMYRLFKKFNPLIYRIVLVGDLDQIPPIEKGQFFSSLIWSKRIPYVRLMDNFRVNASGGDIIRNASMIVDPLRDMKIPIDLETTSGSFNILKGNLRFLRSILKTIDKTLLDSLTIMAPYNSDVNSINKIFQDIKYTRADDYIQDKYTKWYEGDRIMITENVLQDDLANGDLGTIVDISGGTIEVSLDKDEVRRSFSTDKDSRILKHSYCFTINKSQGSEYDAIILYLPIRNTNDFFLNMNLIYTAITRARKMVYIIVEDPMVLVNACNSCISVPKDILKIKLTDAFPDKEYIGSLVEREDIPCDDDDYDECDLDDYY